MLGSRRWFDQVFGFEEGHYSWTRDQFEMNGNELLSKPSGRRFQVGTWELPSLGELEVRLLATESKEFGEGSVIRNHTTGRRGRIKRTTTDEYLMHIEDGSEEWLKHGDAREVREQHEPLTFRNMSASTQELHQDPANAGAVFQVASLYNCLEMAEPSVPPQDGITTYAADSSQGALCSLLCPAGAVFRNYFVNNNSQIDCLAGVSDLVRNKQEGFWQLRNGFCLPRNSGKVGDLARIIEGKQVDVEELRRRLRIGILWDTEVAGCEHRVCQVRCSAIPVSFCKPTKAADWAPLACEVLEAAYRATFAAATLLTQTRGQRVRVYITALGSGAMGNRTRWITRGIHNAMKAFAHAPLDVVLVHSGQPQPAFVELQEHHRAPADLTPPVAPRRRVARTLTGRMGDMADDLKNLELEVAAVDKELSKGSRIAQAFAYFDANGDGLIDRDEFIEVLQMLDSQLFTEERAAQLLQEADADGDGYVHYLEFSAWLAGEDSLINSRVLSTCKYNDVQHVQGLGDKYLKDAEARIFVEDRRGRQVLPASLQRESLRRGR